MSGTLSVLKRELLVFFVTPLAWVLLLVFSLVQGVHFALLVDQFASIPAEALVGQSPVSAFFGNTVIPYVVLFLFVPPLTMRLFAEERRAGTLETLLTAPLSVVEIVLGKYLAALCTYVLLWLPTVLYLIILQRSGALDWRVAAAGYLGVVLVGAGYLAIGLLASAVTNSQFLALVVTSMVLLLMFLLGLGTFASEGSTLHAVSSYVSVWEQMNDFALGVVDSRRLVFDATLIVVPLYLTVRVIDGVRYGGV